MKKTFLSLVLVATSIVGANAKEDVKNPFKNGEVSGQIRLFYIDREFSGTVNKHRSGVAIGGHLKYETGSYKGLSAGVAAYTTNSFGIKEDNLPTKYLDPTLLGEDQSGYTAIGEAYLKYKYSKTTLKVGRQKLNTPLAKSEDPRMVPNFFEAYVLTNSDIKDTTLVLAHVTKFFAGTFANAYKGGALGVTGGYSAVDARTDKFMNMGEYAIGKKTDGVTAFAIINNSIENIKLQLWNYYAHDILNAIYLQGDYSYKINPETKLSVSAQYIKENDVGDSLAGDVDSNLIGLKVGMKYRNIGGYLAYTTTGSDEKNPLGASIISPWGGIPEFTQGMVTRHQNFADTDVFKVAGNYNFKDLGLNLNATLYYLSADVGVNNPYVPNTSWTAKEGGFDIKYYPAMVKNMQVRFRGNFPRDFKPGLDWDEYRFIVNYNF